MTGNEIGEKFGLDTELEGSPLRMVYKLLGNKEYDLSKLIPKVKIPKFVAEYIEACKNYYADPIGIGKAMNPIYMVDEMTDEFHQWLLGNTTDIDNQHQDLFACAWIYGYEIEQEERFILPMVGTYGKDNTKLYVSKTGERWTVNRCFADPRVTIPTVTQSQIDDAPEWVRTIAKDKVKVGDEKINE